MRVAPVDKQLGSMEGHERFSNLKVVAAFFLSTHTKSFLNAYCVNVARTKLIRLGGGWIHRHCSYLRITSSANITIMKNGSAQDSIRLFEAIFYPQAKSGLRCFQDGA
jgi:hypothetical protein